MFLILATGPRAPVEAASKLLDALGGFGAVGWWELERRQFKLEAYAYTEEAAQIGVGAIALSDIELDARIAPLEEADWVKMSLEGLPPVPAGRFRVVGSHDAGKTRNGMIEIIIDAGEAFGTGHHGTTSGCLLALDRLVTRGRRPARVLDVGCGSAILSLGAAKLGARCVGTEIDPRAAWIAGYNARLNKVGPRFRAYVANGVRRAAIREQGPYDLVFANILSKPLIKLCPDIAASVRPGGHVVLSGLLTHQEPGVRRAYAQRGLVLAHRHRAENWSTLTWRRPARAA
jgi:ribosomal protein L11 methyltransferase